MNLTRGCKRGVGIFLLFAVFVVAGCSKPSDPMPSAAAASGKSVEIKVAFWGSPEEIRIIETALGTWQKDHPNIRVRLEHTPYSGYVSKILTRIAGGAPPDVVCTEVDYFVNFSAKNVFEDLTPFVKNDSAFQIDDFFPQVLDRFTVNGKLLVIPRDTAPFACVFYNKKLFDEAGVSYPTDNWTWEEMLQKAKALTKLDNKGRVEKYGFYGWAWQNFVYGNGGELVDNVQHPTQCMLNDPRSIEGLQFYADLIHVHKVMPAPVAVANAGMGIDLMFASGRLGMFLSGIWETPALRKYGFDFDVAIFPQSHLGIRRFGTGGSGYGILSSSKHKAEAWEVVKALTGAQGQIELAKQGLTQPARRSVAESDAWALSPLPPLNKGMLNQAVSYAVYSPFHPKWREIEAKYITPQLDLVFNGKKTVQEAVETMVPEVNAALQETD